MWFVLLAGVVGSGLAAFKYNYNISHDLSVIGKGVPTIVQIHDPNCSLCNQLRRNADAAAEKFGDRMLFRIADISTEQWRRLQRQHDVPHMTLLLFDGEGYLRNVLRGVKSQDFPDGTRLRNAPETLNVDIIIFGPVAILPWPKIFTHNHQGNIKYS